MSVEITKKPIIQTRLKNNLKVVFSQNPSFKQARAHFIFQLGRVYLNQEDFNSLHALEHLILEGNEQYPSPDEIFSRKAGRANGSVDAEETSFWFVAHPDLFTENLRAMCDLIAKPLLTDKALQHEKNIIAQEWKEGQDIHAILMEKYNGLFWPDSPLAKEYRSIQPLESVSLESLTAMHKQLLNPKICTIVITGNFQLEECQAIIDQYFSALSEQPLTPRPNFKLSENLPMLSLLPADQPSSLLRLGFAQNKNILDPIYFPLALLASLLGMAGSGILFDELRRKKGLAYSVHSAILVQRKELVFTFDTVQSTDRMKEVLISIIGIVTNIRQYLEGKDEQLERDKESMILAILSAEDSLEDWSEYLAGVAHYSDVDPRKLIEENIQQVRGVNLESIQKIAEQLLVPEKMGLQIVGYFRPNIIDDLQTLLKDFLSLKRVYLDQDTQSYKAENISFILRYYTRIVAYFKRSRS